MKTNKTTKILVSLCILLPSLAFAHAHLKQAEPANDAVLNELPKQVTLRFSEDLETAMSKLDVTDLKTGTVISEAHATNGGLGKNALQVSLKAVPGQKASYQVNWKAVSKDAHRMQGSYVFTVDPKTK